MKNNTEEFLKNKMKLDENELPELDASVVNSFRAKVAQRKTTKPVKRDFLFYLFSVLNFKIKLYQVAIISAMVIAFFIFMPNEKSKKENLKELFASADTLTSVSVKDEQFLVRNFTVGMP